MYLNQVINITTKIIYRTFSNFSKTICLRGKRKFYGVYCVSLS